jgi:hypothetical protein
LVACAASADRCTRAIAFGDRFAEVWLRIFQRTSSSCDHADTSASGVYLVAANRAVPVGSSLLQISVLSARICALFAPYDSAFI